MRVKSSVAWLIIVVCGFVLVSCSASARYKKTSSPGASTEVVVSKKGPPPHAPAHGYRHKHGNVVLVYHSDIDVYVVDGRKGYYFHEGDFYRTHKGEWQVSVRFDGPWKPISESKLPKGLRHNKQHAKAKKNK